MREIEILSVVIISELVSSWIYPFSTTVKIKQYLYHNILKGQIIKQRLVDTTDNKSKQAVNQGTEFDC
jgi:hypothetical protein